MAESNVAAAPKETQQSAKPTRKGSLLSRVAYSFGNVGQSAFYNALSTYFIVYVTSSLFSGVDKALATKLIGVITGLVVVIRIAEIFIDPLLGNIIDNTKTKWGRFKPWQLIGGTVSAVLLVLVYTGLFGLVNVNTTLFIVLFVITFIVLDVFYSLRDISYWGMIPALSSDSHERSTYTALGSFGGSIGYNGLTIVVIPIVTYFSYIFTGKHQESQSGWTCFAIIVAILGVLTVCSVAFGTKESSSTLRTKAEDNGGPLAAFKALAQNDQLLWVALSYLLYAIANVATTGVLMYMFKFILNNSAAYSIVGVVSVIAGIIMAPLYPILNKRIPRRYLYLGGMVLGPRLPAVHRRHRQPRRRHRRPGVLLPAADLHPDDRHPLPDRLHRIRPAEERQAQRGRHPVRASDARQDRRRLLQRHRRCRRHRRWHDRLRHRRRHDRREHPHLQGLGILCAAGCHHPERRCIPAQGEDHREDARRHRQAAGRAAQRRLIRSRKAIGAIDLRLNRGRRAGRAAWWMPCGSFVYLRS